MGCYKPMIRAEDLTKWVKAEDGHLYHPAKIFSSNRLEEYDSKFRVGSYSYTTIPCGQCIGCRLDYSREWANRGYLESLNWKHNYFVTLTYDEKHLPKELEMTTSEGITYTELKELKWKGILIPKDFTQFMKDLRQEFKRKYDFQGIRFIGCGEYGGKEKRPHYHLILFNCPFPLETMYNPRINWGKDVYYQNKILEKVWDKGISNVCEANWNTIAYTARYITKKVNGKESEDFYAMQGQIPEFLRTSRQPGIGRYYYEEHKEEIYKKDQIIIRNKEGIHYCKPPAYFDRLYEKENPEHFKKIKEQRRQDNIKALKLKAMNTSLTRWEQFQVDREYKEGQAHGLIRNKV